MELSETAILAVSQFHLISLCFAGNATHILVVACVADLCSQHLRRKLERVSATNNVQPARSILLPSGTTSLLSSAPLHITSYLSHYFGIEDDPCAYQDPFVLNYDSFVGSFCRHTLTSIILCWCPILVGTLCRSYSYFPVT